jgi:hypothetical protein
MELEVAEVRLDYLNKYYPIQLFLSSEIRDNPFRTREYIELINKAKEEKDFVYDFSTGNCCWIIISSGGVDIECEYINEKSENIKLDDMKIILEKWLDFTETRKPIEFSW